MGTPDKDYYSHCLQVDLKSAIKSISKVSTTDSKKVISLRKKVMSRFVEQNEQLRIKCKDPFVSTVIATYRDYYRKVLLQTGRTEQLNKSLYNSLRAILADSGRKQTAEYSLDKIEKKLSEEIKKRGYYSLFGSVTPFRSLLVWKKQYSKIYTVSLPEKKQKIEVVFMDDFVELSWMHYATLGRYYVGGWAKKNALYCVKQAYKVGSPEFQAHYLAHEAQHLADYKSFPKLQQTDLEYRAKLTELAVTTAPRKFIQKLKSESKNDRQLPHCFAAFKIISELKPGQPPASLNKFGHELLSIHTKALKHYGAKTVKSVI